MTTKLLSIRTACLSLTSVLCCACGGGDKPASSASSATSAPTGHYTLVMGDTIVGLDFQDGNRVVSTLSEYGDTEQTDCTYQVRGDKVTVKCPEGESRILTFQDGALEANMGDATFKFTKK